MSISRYCQVIIGEQRGEPVKCGAVEAIHGGGLGMVGGHDFRGTPQALSGDAGASGASRGEVGQ